MKVFISGIIPKIGIKMLKEEGYEVEMWTKSGIMSLDQLIAKCKHVNAYINVMSPVPEKF